MIVGCRLLEMVERRFILAAIVQDVREIDASLGVLVIELERSPQRRNCRIVVAEPMLRIPDAGYRFGRLGRLLHRSLEETLCRIEKIRALADRSFAKERSADLQHQVNIVAVAKL